MTEKENTEDSIEEKVVNNLIKTIKIQKKLTPKQQAHIDNLANKKKGSKYKKVVQDNEVNLPEVVIEKPPRKKTVKKVKEIIESESDSTEIVYVKKPKKRVEVIEESSSEEVKVKTKKKAPVKKARPVKKDVEEPKQQFSYFKKSLF